MQTRHLPLAAISLAISLFPATVALADDCTTSFYCYGGSAASTVSTSTRPPPLPPPGRNYLQQRNQAQLAARTAPPTTPQYSPILPRLRLPIAQPVTHSQPIMAQPAPPAAGPVFRSNMPPFPPTNPPISNGGVTCQAAHQNLLARAAALESRAINASKTGQRQQASDMFRDVGKMRADAQRMPCR
jgi:hypothetical protein